MPRPSTARQDADGRTRRIRFEIGREIRAARMEAGLSLRRSAARAGMSHAQFGRIERAEVEDLAVGQMARACSAVGLALHVRAMPDTGAALDAAQLALLGRLRKQLPAAVRVRTEVPLPLPGDRRAWDCILDLDPAATAVEAETRLRDVQALDRRHALKLRDSGLRVMVLLVADTVNNRRVLGLHREDLRASFPMDTRGVLTALRVGRTPPASGIVVL